MAEYTGGAAAAGISAGLGKTVEKIQQRDVAKEMAEFEMDLQIQKAKTLKQVEEQFDIEAEVRARANELWKMETSSRLDFEAQERGRQKEYDEFLTTEKYIRDKVTSGELPSKKAEDLYFMNAYQHSKLDKPEVVARLGSSAEYVQRARTGKTGEESALGVLLKAQGQGGAAQVTEQPNVWVYAPNGKLAQVPADQLEEAVTEGAKLAPGQQLPKSPAFQEAQTQWTIEQQLLKGSKEYVLAELDDAYKVAYNPTIDPKNPFASLIAQSKIADIRKKHPAFFEEYMRRPEGRF